MAFACEPVSAKGHKLEHPVLRESKWKQARLPLDDGTTVKSNLALTSSLPCPNHLPYPNPLQGQMHMYPRRRRTISITMGPFLSA